MHKQTFNEENLPEEGDIFQGKVMKIESFGAFVSLPNCRTQGLLHISQLSKERVENVNDVIGVDDTVFVKVLNVELGDGRPRVSLSMKYISQSDGRDQDGNGIMAESEARRKRPTHRDAQPIQLAAIYNTTCSKCGGSGHIASECYSLGDQKYELIPDDYDDHLSSFNTSTNTKYSNNSINTHRNSESSNYNDSTRRDSNQTQSSMYVQKEREIRPPMGRGRGATLPSWMTSSPASTSNREIDLGGGIYRSRADSIDSVSGDRDKYDREIQRTREKEKDTSKERRKRSRSNSPLAIKRKHEKKEKKEKSTHKKKGKKQKKEKKNKKHKHDAHKKRSYDSSSSDSSRGKNIS